VVQRYTEEDDGRGPVFWLLLEDGREMPFYAREFAASASAVRPDTGAPSAPQAQGNGSGFVLCKGVHAGRQVSMLAVCDRCPEVLGCAELKAAKARGGNGNGSAGKPVARKLF
jgi:hypothetical protein